MGGISQRGRGHGDRRRSYENHGRGYEGHRRDLGNIGRGGRNISGGRSQNAYAPRGRGRGGGKYNDDECGKLNCNNFEHYSYDYRTKSINEFDERVNYVGYRYQLGGVYHKGGICISYKPKGKSL